MSWRPRQSARVRWEYEMAKVAIKRQQLEDILLEKLRAVPYCEGASNVSVHPLADVSVEINWTVSNFNAGTSSIDACAAALRTIERELQELYTLSSEE
jgi:hypothetical protein